MLEQFLEQAVSNAQLITAALLFVLAVLELIQIVQTRRINKKLRRAGDWLQRYLDVVFNEEEPDVADGEEEKGCEPEREMHVETLLPLKSRQEENMRVSLAQKKQKKDEELLDTVLQEIFD